MSGRAEAPLAPAPRFRLHALSPRQHAARSSPFACTLLRHMLTHSRPTAAIQVPSAKVLGKRKQEDEPNGLSNGSDGIIPPHQRVQLVAAFQTCV